MKNKTEEQMREIKFRAWDFKNKEIIEDAMTLNGTLFYKDNPNFVLLQFTGLKDKNGKEIFEGDIVKFKVIGGERKEVIIFEDGCFLAGSFYLNRKDVEIIGNIYENPELLERRK